MSAYYFQDPVCNEILHFVRTPSHRDINRVTFFSFQRTAHSSGIPYHAYYPSMVDIWGSEA